MQGLHITNFSICFYFQVSMLITERSAPHLVSNVQHFPTFESSCFLMDIIKI